jgi:transcription initiation factor TFIIIB Brf1 subunit/transcription initiation factor TFIIB
MRVKCRKCDKVFFIPHRFDIWNHLWNEHNISRNEEQYYYYLPPKNLDDAIEIVYDTFYSGYPTSIKEEAKKLLNMLGKKKGYSYLGLAVVALYVASERLACPINVVIIRRYAKKHKVPFWKLLRKLREFYPRKDSQYYLQCAFNEFVRKIKKCREISEGELARLYNATFLILSLLPRRFLIRTPRNLIAGAIYIAGKLEGIYFTQRDIADILGANDVTIRRHYCDIRDILLDKLEELPTELKAKIEKEYLRRY